MSALAAEGNGLSTIRWTFGGRPVDHRLYVLEVDGRHMWRHVQQLWPARVKGDGLVLLDDEVCNIRSADLLVNALRPLLAALTSAEPRPAIPTAPRLAKDVRGHGITGPSIIPKIASPATIFLEVPSRKRVALDPGYTATTTTCAERLRLSANAPRTAQMLGHCLSGPRRLTTPSSTSLAHASGLKLPQLIARYVEALGRMHDVVSHSKLTRHGCTAPRTSSNCSPAFLFTPYP